MPLSGFELKEEEATALLSEDYRYQDVLFPYLSGDDVNSHPKQKASRWVINFWDWPEERAKQYERAFQHLLTKVRPLRLKDKRKARRDRWWHFAELASGLYHTLGRGHLFTKHPKEWNLVKPLERVIVQPFLGKFLSFLSVSNDSVFAGPMNIFTFEDQAVQAVLLSAIHQSWAWSRSSKMAAARLRYTPSDCVETFPFPLISSTYNGTKLRELARKIDSLRHEIMRSRCIGATDLYNCFNSMAEVSHEFIRLRELQVELDLLVAASYGWSRIDLGYDFHEVSYLPGSDRVRFTIAEEARREILDRLSCLNRERYEEELAQGLHESKTRSGTSRRRKANDDGRIVPFPLPVQSSLFSVGRQVEFREMAEPRADPAAERLYISDTSGPSDKVFPGTSSLSVVAQALLSWLREQTDWRSRSDVPENTGFAPTDWTPAIRELLDAGLVERTGEKRSTRYRAKT